jgi:hypothetical protein
VGFSLGINMINTFKNEILNFASSPWIDLPIPEVVETSPDGVQSYHYFAPISGGSAPVGFFPETYFVSLPS